MLGSPHLIATSSDFCIHDKLPESDHLLISITIICNRIHGTSNSHVLSPQQWAAHCKYQWSTTNLDDLKVALNDKESQWYRGKVIDAMVHLKSCDELARSINSYVTQAGDRTLKKKTTLKPIMQRKFPVWYDNECRRLRGEAIKAGERATSDHEFRELRDKSRAYKSLKQRKTREYRRAAVVRIEQAYHWSGKHVEDHILNCKLHGPPQYPFSGSFL